MSEADNIKDDWNIISQNSHGKKCIEDLRKYCGYDHPCVQEDDPNINSTLIKLGKRKVYLHILNRLKRN